MKKYLAAAFTAIAVMTAISASAAGTSAGTTKDLCLLYSQNCPKSKPTLPELIDKTQREIAKGQLVYSEKEQEILKQKLEEYQRLEELLLYHPSN